MQPEFMIFLFACIVAIAKAVIWEIEDIKEENEEKKRRD